MIISGPTNRALRVSCIVLLAAAAACSSGGGGAKSPEPTEDADPKTPPEGPATSGDGSHDDHATRDSKGPAAESAEGKQLVQAVDAVVEGSSESNVESFKSAVFCFIGRQRAAYGDAWYDRYNEVMDQALATPERYAAFEKAQGTLSGTILGDEDVRDFEKYCTAPAAFESTLGSFAHLSSPSIPEAMPRNCHTQRPRRTGIIFFNGMLTDIGDAIKHKDNIRKAIEEAGMTSELSKGGEGVDYAVAYNQNENWLSQLTQVLSQKGYEQGTSVRQMIRRIWSGKESAKIKDIRETYVSQFDAEKYRNLLDEAKHVYAVKNRLKLNHRLVFVSHSHGNFYSNFAFRSLDAQEQKSVRQVMVATPTTAIADGSQRYTTFANDLIMNLVRTAPGMLVLPAQNMLADTKLDWKDHGFSEVYLPHKDARARILQHIREAAAETVYPDTQISDGRLTATLKWDDTNKDFALHVFEGTRNLDNHVYWDVESGTYGDLEGKVDGKEWDRYTTNCEATPPFQLTFAPQYYSGEGGGHATLTIATGAGLAMELPVDLPEATGATGMLDPPSLVTVKVDLDPGTGHWTVSRLP